MQRVVQGCRIWHYVLDTLISTFGLAYPAPSTDSRGLPIYFFVSLNVVSLLATLPALTEISFLFTLHQLTAQSPWCWWRLTTFKFNLAMRKIHSMANNNITVTGSFWYEPRFRRIHAIISHLSRGWCGDFLLNIPESWNTLSDYASPECF